ncbi:ATP-binding protein [Streptomyces sp. NBC_00249]|uniref:ATP-binding protein n=1 Tax=Streptomyces sp. NBC_00249 TaxID=2975690 RepID=UPI002251F9A4|nr:ATP-binding protein [Streptomyces sp. NBC_00249]MCX5193178.1 ATP-binding protein [Streptomyces sp. NBC_00249]
MNRTSLADPQTAADNAAMAWMRRKLAERGIDPTGAIADTPEAIPALEAAQLRIPRDYREARVEHPAVAEWVRTIAGSAVGHAASPLNPHFGTAGQREITHGRSLLLWGSTGAGKTHQAYAAIRALTASGCGVRWHATTAADLYGEMRARGGGDPEYLLRRIVRIPLLLLDDLGAAKASEWNEEITFRLLNWRAQNQLPTIVTSNLPPVRTPGMATGQPVLRDKVGDRVISRLSGMCTPVHLDGPDRRFRAA